MLVFLVKASKLETCQSCGVCLFSVSQTDLDFLCFLFVASHSHVAPTQRAGRERLTSASEMLLPKPVEVVSAS